MSNKLQYICDYKEDDRYRRSFSQLALEAFGLDFESWYQHGFWDRNYMCHSYVDEDQVVANVSIYKARFMVNGTKKEGVQLVTGMTRPAYRNQGLMGMLVKDLLQQYERQTDFVYIAVANKPMMPFWFKLGFTTLDEKQFFIEMHTCDLHKRGQRKCIQKLDMLKPADRRLLFSLAARRQPVARNFSLENTQNAVMLYCLNEFRDHIYYLPERDVIVIYKQEAGILHLYDLLFYRDRCLSDSISSIIDESTREIIFYFTPEFDDLQTQCRSYEPETIFAARPTLEIRGDFAYPILG